MSNNKIPKQSILIGISIFIVGMTFALIWSDYSQRANTEAAETAQTEETEIVYAQATEDDDPFLGEEDAPIVMIEFSDYQCPFCRKFYNETLPAIKENYIDKGLVKFVYRDFPITSLGHTGAIPAANAAECAREQGGDDMYFAYHDKVFDGQNELGSGTVVIPNDNLIQYAEEFKLNMESFTNCAENLNYKDEIMADFNDGKAAGVTGTPGFFINGYAVKGAYPYDTFEQLFEEILNQ